MNNTDIPSHVWDEAAVVINEEEGVKHFRMDVLWAYMQAMRSIDGELKFPKLANVALLALTLPHSNAAEERVFSMVTKNKTKFRPSLKIDGTLSSILTIKLANPEPCHKFEPPPVVLTSSKKATSQYNKAHTSK